MRVTMSTPGRDAADPDLVDQARPGHGVPSQDPDASAQFPISRGQAREERRTVHMGGGVLVGVAIGAALRAVFAGPVDIVLGGTAGSIAGGLVGAAAGRLQRASPGKTSRERV